MKTMKWAAAAIAATMLAGCGMQPMAPRAKAPMTAAQAKKATKAATHEVTLEAAAAKALAHATATWGGTWALKRCFGDKAWDGKGQALPTTWRVNLLGEGVPGQQTRMYVKLLVTPEGAVQPHPKSPAPFADPWNSHLEPALDVAKLLPADQGVALALATRLGPKFPPISAIDFEAGYADRLKRKAARFKWRAQVDGTLWYVEAVLDPETGDVIELDASHV